MQGNPTLRGVRASDDIVRMLLDQLDQSDGSGAVSGMRAAERFAYRRHSLRVDVQQPDGSWLSYVCPTRNISRDGVGLLLGQFVYANTRIRIHLVTLQNQTQQVLGAVMNCRYIPGTGSVHEVGARLDAPVDVAMFNRDAQRLHVLLVSADPALTGAASQLLAALNIDCTVADSADAAFTVAGDGPRAILFDGAAPGFDAARTAGAARQAGNVRPLLCLAGDAAQADQALAAGFNWFVEKPLSVDGLNAALHEVLDDPRFSSAIHEPLMKDFVDGFVAELRGRVLEFEQAFVGGSKNALSAAAQAIADEAAQFGFDAIGAAARALSDAIAAGATDRAVRQALNRLTRACLAARSMSLAPIGARPAPPA
ncbi:hypothetical protein RAS1_15070 [Phycisphaerae bacterium RAS1]|nr:hypothetical protein RAS1_15070 [Phycisphaerae bacterium RAS1]